MKCVLTRAALALIEGTVKADGLLAAVGLTVLALGLAWFARRRLPSGVGEGLLLSAVSGLLVLHYVRAIEAPHEFLLTSILVSLAGLWFMVGLWVEREAAEVLPSAALERRDLRRDLALHITAVSGLLAVAVMIFAVDPNGVLTLGLTILLGMLLAVVIGVRVRRRDALSRHAVIGLLMLLIWLAVPRSFLAERRGAIAWLLLAGGLVALGAVCVALVWDWRQRVSAWRCDPLRAPTRRPPHPRLHDLIAALCVVVGLGAALPAVTWVSPLAVLLAAYAAFVVGHVRPSDAAGELGLALSAETIFLAALTWLPASPASGLLGMALAGVFLAWLPRFWQQQLDDGRPWTTTGRLVPMARNLSHAAAGVTLVLAAVWALRTETGGESPGWQGGAAVLFLLLYWSMLVRESADQRSRAAALAAGLVLLAVLVPASCLVGDYATTLTPGAWLAGGALLLALRTRRIRTPVPAGAIYNAYVGGFLPLAVAYDVTLRGTWTTNSVVLLGAVGGLVMALGVRWGGDWVVPASPMAPAPRG